MVAETPVITTISIFTLAIIKDFGLYAVDLNKAEEFYWGKHAGCSFFTNFCGMTDPKTAEYTQPRLPNIITQSALPSLRPFSNYSYHPNNMISNSENNKYLPRSQNHLSTSKTSLVQTQKKFFNPSQVIKSISNENFNDSQQLSKLHPLNTKKSSTYLNRYYSPNTNTNENSFEVIPDIEDNDDASSEFFETFFKPATNIQLRNKPRNQLTRMDPLEVFPDSSAKSQPNSLINIYQQNHSCTTVNQFQCDNSQNYISQCSKSLYSSCPLLEVIIDCRRKNSFHFYQSLIGNHFLKVSVFGVQSKCVKVSDNRNIQGPACMEVHCDSSGTFYSVSFQTGQGKICLFSHILFIPYIINYLQLNGFLLNNGYQYLK